MNETLDSGGRDQMGYQILAEYVARYLLKMSANFTSTAYQILSSKGSNSLNKSKIILPDNDLPPNTTLLKIREFSRSNPGDDDQINALIFIVVVLSFYAFGIGFMMIKYMKKEEKEEEESKMYRQYVNAAQEQYRHSTSRARLANRLALQALNTVNAIPQTRSYGRKVTFV